MTLQYRTRSTFEDNIWQERVRLSNCLLMECVDVWCRSDADFPTDEVIASILYLFSPRCYSLGVSECRLREYLVGIVGTPAHEYSATRPQHGENQRSKLIDALSRIVGNALIQWGEGTLLDPSIETVNRQIVEEIVEQQYVIFHHYHTTRRDFGGFYGSS